MTERDREGRPPFERIQSFAEFSQYYWYREELQQICRQLGIDASGMKAELNRTIEAYFAGNLIPPKARRRNTSRRTRGKAAAGTASEGSASPTDIPLSLDTGLIACDFRFSQRFRDFFSEQTGIRHFKFNADMVATAKKVKEDHDESFTLGDMLDVFYGRKSYARYDKVSLQWNRFVRDFCADPAAAQYPDRLKAAACLWREVRSSTREKVYTPALLEIYADKLAAFTGRNRSLRR